MVRHFYATITENPIYEDVVDKAILKIPSADDWESMPSVTHIVPVHTRARYNNYLYLHLLLVAKTNAVPVGYPAVPKGTERIRLLFHAHNSNEEVERVAGAICDWAKEMLEIESGKEPALSIPTAPVSKFTVSSRFSSVRGGGGGVGERGHLCHNYYFYNNKDLSKSRGQLMLFNRSDACNLGNISAKSSSRYEILRDIWTFPSR